METNPIQLGGAIAAPAPTIPSKPMHCPFCGQHGMLTYFENAAGFIEKGCFDHQSDEYCFEGCLPGYDCRACGNGFILDVDDDVIHADCSCDHNEECECGRYAAARAALAATASGNR